MYNNFQQLNDEMEEKMSDFNINELRNKAYKDKDGLTNHEAMAWDYLHGNNGFREHSLSGVLKEMGFPEDSYMVVRKGDNSVKVGDHYDANGQLVENPYSTFGGYHKHPNSELDMYDDNNEYMRKFCCSSNGQIPNGITGSNNGVYSAQAYGGDEVIVTKDRRIKEALEEQLSFKKDVMGVPLSNGGIIMDSGYRDKWNRVKLWGNMVDNHRKNGDKLPEPKYLNIQEKYKKIEAARNTQMLNKMNRFSR